MKFHLIINIIILSSYLFSFLGFSLFVHGVIQRGGICHHSQFAGNQKISAVSVGDVDNLILFALALHSLQENNFHGA